jgi:uncharacterized repeat protein (TIGR03803 family)
MENPTLLVFPAIRTFPDPKGPVRMGQNRRRMQRRGVSFLGRVRVVWVQALVLPAVISSAACSSAARLVPPDYGAWQTGAPEFRSDAAYRTVYSFGAAQGDAVSPLSTLIPVNGQLYGTSIAGGSNANFGAIFRVTPVGRESVLHSFVLNFKGGLSPQSELVNFNGFLYGTTEYGGSDDGGSIYATTTEGTFRTIHSFKGSPADGSAPFGGLVALNGTLYGTTANGGAYGYGTFFSFKDGLYHVLHSFSKSDGAYPHATLTMVGSALYGVTNVGGTSDHGVVFRMDTNGTESVIHSFDGANGYDPEGRLLALNGMLYGTTVYGGAYNHGTVFQLSMSGQEKLLYSFDGTRNGCSPYAGLTAVDGLLYGVTSGGGAKCNTPGTLFRISPTGAEKTLHTFGQGHDGANPYGGLLLFHKLLYGTAARGGEHSAGTVFSQIP